MRQHEIEQEREVERPPVPARRETPGLGRLNPAAILALQRTAGNRAIARRVTAELRQAPPRPTRVPASDQASPENRHLAAEIDDVDKLDDPALDKQRAENATQVATTEGSAHAAAVEKHNAIEYVAAQRSMKAPP